MNKNLLRIFFLFTIILSSNSLFAQKNVNVTEFTVSTAKQKVKIDWKTDGAVATNYFAIQKSTDGINYRTVALVLGPDPKQNNCDCYACSDKYAKTTKKSYYRIVHIDTEGNEQITEPKVLAIP